MKSKTQLWDYYTSSITPKTIPFSFATPDQKAIAHSNKLIKQALKQLLNKRKLFTKLLTYSPPQGLPDLISTLKSQSNHQANQFIVTQGAQQSLSLVFNALLKTSDPILIENYNYLGLETLIKKKFLKLHTFSKPLNQLSFNSIKNQLTKFKPKLIYLNPDFSNPIGETLSLPMRQELIKLVKKHSIILVEDQAYRPINYNQTNLPPSLKFLYPSTLSIHTVSKTLGSGLRLGWINTPQKFYSSLLASKKATDLFSPPITQITVNQILNQPKKYSFHLKKINAIYRSKMTLLLKNLDQYFPSNYSWNAPLGGFFIWVKGPKSFNSKKFFQTAIQNHVSFLPGYVFAYQPIRSFNTFRLSIAQIPKNQISKGIKKLSQLLP